MPRLQAERRGLSYEKLIGWNSDGASVMLGIRNNVVSRLKEKQPNLYVLHCVCQISHLMVNDVVKCIPSYVINLTENLFWWFHNNAISSPDPLDEAGDDIALLPIHLDALQSLSYVKWI